jgi:hypothetical protein
MKKRKKEKEAEGENQGDWMKRMIKKTYYMHEFKNS